MAKENSVLDDNHIGTMKGVSNDANLEPRNLRVDPTSGALLVGLGNTRTYISTATTTVVKSGLGTLHTLTVTGGTTGTIVIYDNTAGSGTIIASFTTTNALATYTFDCSFTTGLTIVTSAATQMTVTWK